MWTGTYVQDVDSDTFRIPHLPSQDVRPDKGIADATDQVARGFRADVDLCFLVESGK